MPLLNVLLASITMMLVSRAWYSQAVFGKTVMRLSDISDKQCNGRPPLFKLISAFVLYLTINFLIGLVDVMTAGDVHVLAPSIFVIWLFVSLNTYHAVIWDNLPYRLYLIYCGHGFLNFLSSALIFSLNR